MKTSNAAKAASMLYHTWGLNGYAQALEVYNAIGQHPNIIVEDFLETLGAGRWAELDALNEFEWWENVESLALSIDAAREWEKTL